VKIQPAALGEITEMEVTPANDQRRRIGFMAALAIFTGLLGGFPFLVYGWGRVTGSIPGNGIWPEMVGNHGPWWDSWMGAFLFFSFLTLLILPILTMIAVTILFIKRRKAVLIFQGITLIIAQWGLAIAHFFSGFGWSIKLLVVKWEAHLSTTPLRSAAWLTTYRLACFILNGTGD